LPYLYSPANHKTQPERVSLEVASQTVWLGMPKAEVIKKFSGAGYRITDTGKMVIVTLGDEAHSFQFTNDRLAYADNEWYSANTEDIDAVLGALGALADKNASRPCSIFHQPISKPDAILNRVFIVCGDRSVLIANGKLFGKAAMDISERIGNIPDSSQK
jgi:hypothetical protein